VSGVEFNFCALVVGPPQYGKTTILRELVIEHLRTYPTGLALVHDPNLQLRDVCATYEDAAHWKRAFDEHLRSGKPFPRGASIGGEAEDIRNEAIALGKARNSADNVRIPILLGFDESSLLDSSSSTHIGKDDRRLLCMRRHWGIGPIYNAQTVTGLDTTFFVLSTLVIVLSQASERETEKLEQRIGVLPGATRGLVMAPPFRYIRWERGKGLR
jgi:hypothetical protein